MSQRGNVQYRIYGDPEEILAAQFEDAGRDERYSKKGKSLWPGRLCILFYVKFLKCFGIVVEMRPWEVLLR